MTLSVMLILTKRDGLPPDRFISGLVMQGHTQSKEERYEQDDNQPTDENNPLPDRMSGDMLIVQSASVPSLAPVHELGICLIRKARISKLSAVFTAAPFHRPPQCSELQQRAHSPSRYGGTAGHFNATFQYSSFGTATGISKRQRGRDAPPN